MKYIDILLEKIAKNKKIQFCLFFSALLFLSSLIVFFYDNMFFGHDFYFHLRRFNALVYAISEGTFPYYLDYKELDGYGYLSNTFYSDITLVPFYLVAKYTDSITALKTLIFVMSILCGLFTYKAVNDIYKNTLAASISGLLYTFCNYRLIDIYFRCAIGEVITFTFVPLVFLGLYHIVKGDYKRKWYIIAMAFILMIFTHVLSTVLAFVAVAIFLLLYAKMLIKEPKRLAYLVLAGVIALICTSYFIFPMIEQLTANTYYYQAYWWAHPYHNTVGLSKMIWGMLSGLSMPRQEFIPRLGLLVTLFVSARLFISNRTELIKMSDKFLIVGILFFIAITPLFPWLLWPFSLFDSLQFAWRLFEFASFFLVVAGSYYFSQSIKSYRSVAIVMVCMFVFQVMTIRSESDNFQSYHLFNKDITLVLETPRYDNKIGSIGGAEYLPSKVPKSQNPDYQFFMNRAADSIRTVYDNTDIANFERKGKYTLFDVETDKSETLELPLVYYKGYKATLNGIDIPIKESEFGLVETNINQSGRVEVYYAGTMLLRICFWISLTGILALCVYIVFNILQNRRSNA